MAVDFEIKGISTVVSTYYCSSTHLYGVAKRFAEGSDANPYENKGTIFLINPKLSQVKVAGDVSWISPFPEEAEVIVKIDECAPFYNPNQLIKCAKRCSSLDCYHARNSVKQVTLLVITGGGTMNIITIKKKKKICLKSFH